MHNSRLAFTLAIFLGLVFTMTVHAAPRKADKAAATVTQKRGLEVTEKNRDSRKRVALVIGNSAYTASPLKNPVNDAAAMATALRRLGFDVEEKANLGYIAMNEAVESFGNRLKSGGIGLFYYAGHGMQVQGNNYLIPVDAKINSENEVRYKALDAGLVMAKMEQAKSDVNIVVLDACRDNPFGRSFRSANRGLASMDAPNGTFIAYATAPGKTAADGNGKNGLYTEELLKVLEKPGLKLEDVFKQTSRGVKEKSANLQSPWVASNLDGDFWFVPSPDLNDIKQTHASNSVIKQSEKPVLKSISTPTNLPPTLTSTDFLEELENYINQSKAPVTEIKRLAESGDLLGEARLCAIATHERYNLGVRPEDGVSFCRILAEQEIAVGMFLYGRAYAYGKGVEKDLQKGINWYRRAADKGNTSSMTNLGVAYINGTGVIKDEHEAARWFRMGAEKGNTNSMIGLGNAYLNGRGAVKDEHEAVKWFRLAAEKNNKVGMYSLGVVYENGRGVTKDEALAVIWYRKAAERGYSKATDALKRLGK